MAREKKRSPDLDRHRPALVRISGEKRVANDRERKFVQEYMKCFNMKKAALAAGYSEQTASKATWQIMNRPWVQEYLEHLRAKYELDAVADVQEVIKMYTDQMRGKIKETTEYKKYVYVEDQETGKRKRKYVEGYEMNSTLIKAGAEYLGKYYKLFGENSINLNVAPVIVSDIPEEMEENENAVPTFEEALEKMPKFEDLENDKPTT